jgi:predicted TIM-barrel enzyme
MDHFLGRLDDLGFSGVINFPTVGLIDGRIRAELEATGLGFEREIEMIRLARKRSFFTMVYVFTPEEARLMADAGADVIVAHLGTTVGGTTGMGKEASVALERAPGQVDAIGAAAKEINREVLVLSHGGPIATPEDARYVLERCDAVGFVGASSMERLPVETAISGTTRRFKDIQIRRR